MNLNKILPGSSSQATVAPWRRATLRLCEQPSEGGHPPTRSPAYLLQIHEVNAIKSIHEMNTTDSMIIKENFRTDIYLQHLVSTDIRTVHSTLFHLHNCLGIYNTTSVYLSSSHIPQLTFPAQIIFGHIIP